MAYYGIWPQNSSNDLDLSLARVIEDDDILFDDQEPQSSFEEPASVSIVPKSIYNNPPTKEDWRKIRPVFTNLYFTEAKPLKEVMRELGDKHGFHGSEKMCKTHITRWNLRRSLNRDEVIQILGTEAVRKAQGKRTVFWLRGQLVDMDNIHRYQRRNGLKTSDAVRLFSLRQAKPCLEVKAASPPDTSAATILVEPEHGLKRCLFEYRAMLDGLVECQSLIFDSNKSVLLSKLTRVEGNEIIDVAVTMLSELFDQSYFLSLRRFSILLEHVAKSSDPMELCNLLGFISRLRFKDIGAAEAMGKHLRSLLRSDKALARPSAKFWMAIIEINEDEIALTSLKLSEVYYNKEAEVQNAELGVVESSLVLERQMISLRRRMNLGFSVDKYQYLTYLKDYLGHSVRVDRTVVISLSFLFRTWPELSEATEIERYLTWLTDPAKLSTNGQGVPYDGFYLSFETAFGLSDVYYRIGEYELQRSVLQHLLDCYEEYRLSDDELLHVLKYLDWLSTESNIADGSLRWREMMTTIEDAWLAEVEAAVPDDHLLEACRY